MDRFYKIWLNENLQVTKTEGRVVQNAKTSQYLVVILDKWTLTDSEALYINFSQTDGNNLTVNSGAFLLAYNSLLRGYVLLFPKDVLKIAGNCEYAIELRSNIETTGNDEIIYDSLTSAKYSFSIVNSLAEAGVDYISDDELLSLARAIEQSIEAIEDGDIIADSAVKDQNGNVIDETYATIEYVDEHNAGGGGGGGDVPENLLTTDDVVNNLSSSSTDKPLSAYQGNVLNAAFASYYTKTQADTLFAGKQNALTFDLTPTQNSTNPVTSGGVYAAIAENIPEQYDGRATVSQGDWGDFQTLLWENANPTSAFSSATITIDGLSNYDYLVFVFNPSDFPSHILTSYTEKFANSRRTASDRIFLSLTATIIGTFFERFVTIDGDDVIIGNATADGDAANSFLIPVAIYGTNIA